MNAMRSHRMSTHGAAPVAPVEPTTGTWLITPERAGDWLNRYNGDNPRPLIPSRVVELKGAFQRGEHKFNGEPLIFSDRPHLMSGQHYLTAVNTSGVAVVKSVVVGVPEDAADTIDNITRRRNSDRLYVMGEENCKQLASAITLLWRWEREKEKGKAGFMSTLTPSAKQQADLLQRHPLIRESVKFAHRGRDLGSVAVLAFMHYVTCMESGGSQHWNEFYEKLVTGIGMVKGDPVLLLRERLISARGAKARLHQIQILALYIKAWTAHRSGKKLSFLRWRQEGDSPEPFPSLS